jgi:hypothetical protein
MREFPAWKRPTVDWPNVVQERQSQLRQIVADLGAGAGSAMRAIPSRAVEIAELTRRGCEQVPNAIVGELRRRVNPLELATKQDVEAQSKLGRNRVSFVLKEFLEGQRSHDEALVESIRAELREELHGFAAALSDDLLANDAPAPLIETERQRPAADLEFVTSVDDETDGADDEWILSSDNERIDLIDEEVSTRRRARYETYE